MSSKRHETLTMWQEFRWQNFGLHHNEPEDFCRSQWQRQPRCRWFLIYRWLLAACFGTGVITCMIKYFMGGHWFLYLTNWGFFLCGVTSVVGAVIASAYQASPDNMVAHTGLLKCYWACYWTNLVLAHVIALVYWSCIYPRDRSPENPMRTSTLCNIWTHALPTLLFSVDHMVVASPARLLHFVYPMSLSVIYVGFTYVYWRLGGLDPLGRPNLYPFWNWAKPLRTLATSAFVCAQFVGCSLLQFGVFRLRVFLAGNVVKEL